MKTSSHLWARIAEIAGAVAVVVSVIYLALQVSANNKLLRSHAHCNALSLAQRPLEMTVENKNLAEIVTHCDADPDSVATAGIYLSYVNRGDCAMSCCFSCLDSIPWQAASDTAA